MNASGTVAADVCYCNHGEGHDDANDDNGAAVGADGADDADNNRW